MNLRLYGEKIPYDAKPKFLGVVFDPRMNFKNHFELIKNKKNDRLNILKILFFDKNWRLDQNTLIQIFKSLIRSVIDYASVTLSGLSQSSRNGLEVIQNNALRTIIKKRLSDRVPVECLRELAGISHQSL